MGTRGEEDKGRTGRIIAIQVMCDVCKSMPIIPYDIYGFSLNQSESTNEDTYNFKCPICEDWTEVDM